MTANDELDRRAFLKATLVTGGALVFGLGLGLPTRSRAEERFNLLSEPAADFQPNAFIKIATNGKVTITVGQAEMGQGVLTSLPMIIADELEVDWADVSFEPALADKAFINPEYGSQITGGSNTVRAFFDPLRRSSAAVREMLVTAAANKWNVTPDACRADSGKVIHTATNRIAKYGDLLAATAAVPVPANPKLKDPKDFKYIGKAVKRLDTPLKVNGSAVFGIDLKLPGMLTASILRAPVIGGKVKTFDDSAAKAVKGVCNVVSLGYGVGVVADNFWAARKGRSALKVVWDDGPMSSVSTESIYKMYAKAAENDKGVEAKKVGDITTGRSKAALTIDAVYNLPYLAHASMEPMTFTADYRPDSCEVWGGNQAQTAFQRTIAEAVGLPPEKVKINTTLLGGAFGRRSYPDYAIDAALLSKAVGKPVKIIWTREDDITNDYYRPTTYNKISAGLDANGMPVFWHQRVVNASILQEFAPIVFGAPFKDELDFTACEGASTLPYEVQNLQVDWVRKETGVPVGIWRSVGSSHTGFSTECFLDELAHAAKKDPLEFRFLLLEKHPRHAGVLKLAAEKAGWGKPAPKGVYRGIAVHECFGSQVAEVAEVSIEPDGRPKVHRVVCAVDCGQVVNPDTVIAQIEGAVIFGLTAALYGEITIKDGRVQQSNFHDYKILRMNETPKIEVHIVPSTEKHGGIGEVGTPPIAPAVCNAIFAATGKRIRSLPIRPEELRGA